MATDSATDRAFLSSEKGAGITGQVKTFIPYYQESQSLLVATAQCPRHLSGISLIRGGSCVYWSGKDLHTLLSIVSKSLGGHCQSHLSGLPLIRGFTGQVKTPLNLLSRVSKSAGSHSQRHLSGLSVVTRGSWVYWSGKDTLTLLSRVSKSAGGHRQIHLSGLSLITRGSWIYWPGKVPVTLP
jgi:hypothetical protein